MKTNKDFRQYIISNDPHICGTCLSDEKELNQEEILQLQLSFVFEDYLSRHGVDLDLSISLSIDEDDNCHASCAKIKNELFIDISTGFLKKIFYTSTLSTLSYYIYCALIDDTEHYSSEDEGLADLTNTLEHLRLSIYAENTTNLSEVKIADLAENLYQKYWFTLKKIGHNYESTIRFILAHELFHLLQSTDAEKFESEIDADTQALLCSANFKTATTGKHPHPTELLELPQSDDYKSAMFLMTYLEIVDSKDSKESSSYLQSPCKTHTDHPGGMHRFIHLASAIESENPEIRKFIKPLNRLILGWRNCAIIACTYPRKTIPTLIKKFISSEKQQVE